MRGSILRRNFKSTLRYFKTARNKTFHRAKTSIHAIKGENKDLFQIPYLRDCLSVSVVKI